MYVNKCFVLGNLTRDPELKALTNGGSIATFAVATNRRVKKGNETQEVPDFHNIVVFGKQAESCAQYLKKGSSAHIEGRIQTRTFDKDGVKHYRTEIIAERVQFGPRPSVVNGAGKDIAPENDPDQRPPSERNAGGKEGGKDKGSEPLQYPDEDINPDDIPF